MIINIGSGLLTLHHLFRLSFSYCSLQLFLFVCVHKLKSICRVNRTDHKKHNNQSFPEDLHESTPAMKNETSTLRGKREAIYNLTDVCSPPSYFPLKSAYGCEKGRYSCYKHVEKVCNIHSIQCLSNVPQYGFPKCTPDFEFVTIDLGSRGKIKIRSTRGCHC